MYVHYSLRKVNIIWHSSHTTCLSSLPDFCFLHHSWQCTLYPHSFLLSQVCNMIVLAAHLMGTLFGPQIIFLMRKNLVKENSLGTRVISDFKYCYQPENAKKNSCYRHSQWYQIEKECKHLIIYDRKVKPQSKFFF